MMTGKKPVLTGKFTQGRRENSRGTGQSFSWGPYDVIIFKQQD